MVLKNSDYITFANQVKQKKSRIIVYGAGMIGQVIIPYLLDEYGLLEYLDCFIDKDSRKKDQRIEIGDFCFKVCTPDYLKQKFKNTVILITNSKFSSVVNYLNEFEGLKETDGYIVPVMQLHEIQNAIPLNENRKLTNQRIPRKIHYCWFGGNPLPDFLNDCISTWRKFCPEYEIIEWTERNYDISRHKYTKEAYACKKFGFVSDFARLDILYEQGGIYFDTDVTLVSSIDHLLYQKGFIGVEKWGNINSGGGCGFEKYHPMLKKLIDYRENISFLSEDGLNCETNGLYETKVFLKEGFKPDNTLQKVGGVTVYPSFVFHPYDYLSGELHSTKDTVSVHHFNGGWMDENDLANRKKTMEEYRLVMGK